MARKDFFFLNHKMSELKETLYLVYFFHFIDMETESKKG